MIKKALKWVNDRHNRLHVRLLEATGAETPVTFWGDGFSKKLNFKKHPRLSTLKLLLSKIDRHCVSSTLVLQKTKNAMTMQGLMSSSRGFLEKQYQKPLHEGWVTGFPNKERLAALDKALKRLKSERVVYERLFMLINEK